MGTNSSQDTKNMGSPKHKSARTPSINGSMRDDDDELIAEVSGMTNCCGIQISKNRRSNGLLSWEDNAILGLQKEGSGSCWADDVRLVVQKKFCNRKKFMREYNDIKYLNKQPNKLQRESPLNPAQINNFKTNFKKSVLLHPEEVLHPSLQANSYATYRETIKQQNLSFSMMRQNGKRSMIAKTDQDKSREDTKDIKEGKEIKECKHSKESIESNEGKENISERRDESYISISRIARAMNQQNVRESVICLVDDTVSSMFKGEEKEVIKLNAYQLEVFVKFTVMLQRHLSDPQNKIHHMIISFAQSMYKAYPQFRNPNSESLHPLEMQHFLQTVKKFLSFLAQTVLDYYNLSQTPDPREITNVQMKSFHSIIPEKGEIYNHLINSFENVFTIVTSILFKEEQFYSFIFETIKAFNRSNDERAKRLFAIMNGRGPEQFSVRKQYCLNSNTLRNIIDGMSVQSNIENVVAEDLYIKHQQPYKNCAQCLKKLQKQRTPISKMKCILQCAQKITSEITEFYENNDSNINMNYKMIDADQVLSIFCYILSVSPIADIFSQVFLIDHFATEYQKMSMTGYYYIVLSSAVEQNFGEEMEMREEQLKEETKNGKKLHKSCAIKMLDSVQDDELKVRSLLPSPSKYKPESMEGEEMPR